MIDQPVSRRHLSPRHLNIAAEGLWATPVANDDNKTPEAHLAMKRRMGERDGTGADRTAITSLNVLVRATEGLWSTPRATDGEKGGPGMAFGAGGEPLPAQAAGGWQTPTVTDAAGRGYTYPGGDRESPFLALTGQAGLWATPKTPNGGRTVAGERTEAGREGEPQSPHLEAQAGLSATPASRDWRSGESNMHGANARPLNETAVLGLWLPTSPSPLPAPRTEAAGGPSSPAAPGSPPPSPRRRLNPFFVNWLMMWPTHWTIPASMPCGRAATESACCRLRWLCDYYAGSSRRC
jgi:hypothetical protein